jgi:hypothetical protein
MHRVQIWHFSGLIYYIWVVMCIFLALMHIIQFHTIGPWKSAPKRFGKSCFWCLLNFMPFMRNVERFQGHVWQESTTDVSFIGFLTLQNWKTCLKKMIPGMVPWYDLNKPWLFF